ncbi:MAG: rod shape-determining protein MreC [Flavobacteriaceae bacterium]|nr:rod shape-determining protein MreC [Flavobacteriaceae bacterium]
MQQIIYFILRNKNFLLFFVLFLISVFLTINSHSYHKNQYVNSANFISGGIYSVKSSITDYFDLKNQNEKLAEENRLLHLQLQNIEFSSNGSESNNLVKDSMVSLITGKVINNSYSKTKNQLTINKGSINGVKIDMGVISPEGLVGIVSHTSKNFASVQSILNSNSQVAAKFKKSNHFGSLVWDGKEYNVVQLKEIPRVAHVALGDTIVTDGRSTIFPEGILIGTVKDFEIEEVGDYYNINIDLFADMTSLKHVYLVARNDAQEIKQLEKEANNVEQ